MCRAEQEQVTAKRQGTLRTSGGQVGEDIVWTCRGLGNREVVRLKKDKKGATVK